MKQMFNDKTILVTGGTGSFGKQFTKSILKKYKIKKLIVFSRDELKQFEMSNSIQDSRIRFFLGDVRDLNRLERALDGVDYVVHAAALKQVEAAEYNPDEFVKTNVMGAKNIIEASINAKVKKVIALSTDKASMPVNLYGATKLVADKLFVAANNLSGKKNTKFSIVRYGNVINSRGSVVPIFNDIINQNKKFFPITNKEMTRFLITLDQGVNFVIESLQNMLGGEIFIPKMHSTKITNLAKILNPNIQQKIIGTKLGEKINETMWSIDETRYILEYKNKFIILPEIILNLSKKSKYSHLLKQGKLLKDNYVYSSKDTSNTTDKDIKELLKQS